MFNNIAKLGFHYLEIRRFIQSQQYSNPGNTYCNALCGGLAGEPADATIFALTSYSSIAG
jgi:hypothetical protein